MATVEASGKNVLSARLLISRFIGGDERLKKSAGVF